MSDVFEKLLSLIWPWKAYARRLRKAWAEAAGRLGLVYRVGDYLSEDRLSGTIGPFSVVVFYQPNYDLQKLLTWFEVRSPPLALAPDRQYRGHEVVEMYQTRLRERAREAASLSYRAQLLEESREAPPPSRRLLGGVFVENGAVKFLSIFQIDDAAEIEAICRGLILVAECLVPDSGLVLFHRGILRRDLRLLPVSPSTRSWGPILLRCPQEGVVALG